MNDEDSADEPRTGSGLMRKLAIGLVALLVLVVVLYFVVSSSAFIKGVILPRVAKSLNSEITVADVSLSPFSQLTVDKLKVQPHGAEPLLTAEQLRVRYSLVSILRGNYVINELTLASPVVQIVRETNGTSNLEVLSKGQESKPSSSTAGPLHLAVRNLSLKDGTIRKIDKANDGSVSTIDLSQLNITLDRLENGQSGKLTLSSGVKLDNRLAPGKPGTNDLMEGKATGSFEFKLDEKLLPQTVTGNANLGFGRGEGAYAELAGLNSVVQAEMTPTELRQLAVRFERAGQGLGRVQASGPLDLTKSEGRLKIEVQSIDRQVLNLFGAAHGWDFTTSTLNGTNTVDFARRGEILGAKGLIIGRQISLQQSGGPPTPALDIDFGYEVTVNLNDQTAVVTKLELTGQQQKKDFLRASLDKPMTLTWASTAKGFADSAFGLTLTQLDLRQWQPVLGTNIPSGLLDWQLSVTNRNDGKQLIACSTNTIEAFSARFGTNQIQQAKVSLILNGKLENFNTVSLDQFNLDVQQLQQPLAKADGSAHYDLAKKDLTLQANAELALPALLRQFPFPPLTASKGVVRLSSTVTRKNTKSSLTGNLFLGDFTGSYGSYVFQDYQTALDYNLDVEQPAVKVHSASLTLRRGYNAAGNVSVSGDYDLDKGSASLTFKVVDLNENALGPILAPSLGDKELVSIAVNGGGSTTYDPKGDTALKADLSLTNWVVTAPQFAAPTLSAQLQVDGSMHQQVVDLRQLLVKLSPTKRATNELQVKARLDLGKTNATPSQFTLQADSLDLTPYYDMFAGAKKPTNAPAARPAPAPAPAAPVKPSEPAPATLPFEQLTADVKIGQLYVRELAITNLQTTAKINHGEVSLKPCEMNLNGAPVSANALLNLAVRGYTYDVGFKADGVPLEPLSDTFTTNAPGQFKGDLFASAQVKGAGITDASLQKNLSGNLSLNLTNMNYEIVGQKAKRLLEPISLVLRVPELMLTPINWVGAKANVGKGQIDLQQFVVQSQAFHAESHGSIPMADELTNSPLNLPVALSLNQSLAAKVHLVPADAPTNTTYAPLPTFVTLAGTLGDPKTEINKAVIAGLLARSISGLVPVGGQAGSILQGLGNALSGQSGATTSTNAPASTNASRAATIFQGLSDLLNQPKKDGATTNNPAVTTNKPATFNPLDLLNKALPEKK